MYLFLSDPSWNDRTETMSINFVTVITVAYNAGSTISEACHSVSSQDLPIVEHLVIDGASTDKTVEFARSSIRVGGKIVSEPDRGIYDAMNKGLKLACGDVVGFLNADDCYDNDRVLSDVSQVMTDQTVDCCFADVVYVDVDDLNVVRRVWRSGPNRPTHIPYGWIPAHPTFYARRWVYERFRGFNLNYSLAADHECLSRLLYCHRIRAVYVPKIWVRMRVGGATNVSWKNIYRQNREILTGMRANRIPISPFFPIWKTFDRVRQRFTGGLRAKCVPLSWT